MFLKSKATGCGSISTVFSSMVLLCVGSIVIIIELIHSKTRLEITVKIESQPAALDFKNLSQYSSHSK